MLVSEVLEQMSWTVAGIPAGWTHFSSVSHLLLPPHRALQGAQRQMWKDKLKRIDTSCFSWEGPCFDVMSLNLHTCNALCDTFLSGEAVCIGANGLPVPFPVHQLSLFPMSGRYIYGDICAYLTAGPGGLPPSALALSPLGNGKSSTRGGSPHRRRGLHLLSIFENQKFERMRAAPVLPSTLNVSFI